MKNFSIAVDGPSGAGKSSLSKKVAGKYGIVYVDTGAIYRTVGLYCYRHNIERKDPEAVSACFGDIDISIEYDSSGLQRMILNGEDVTSEIRLPEISICASDVSSLSICRDFLMDMQRTFAMKYSVIMDGRDIGTVVLPDADLKIYLTASSKARAERRLKELLEKGTRTDFESVLKDIEYRDWQDTHREAAPLRQAEDAVVLDTSELDFEESFAAMCAIIEQRLGITASENAQV